MNNRLRRIISSFIIFIMVFTTINLEISSDSIVFASESYDQTNTAEEVTVNDGIGVLIDYFNNDYYRNKSTELTGWEYLAMVKSNADLSKKNWSISDELNGTNTLATRANQAIILLELGKDPTEYNGINLKTDTEKNLIEQIVEELNGINSSRFIINEIKAMIAVDRFNEKFESKKITYDVEKLIKLVLNTQSDDGCVDKAVGNTAYAVELFSRHQDIEGVTKAKEKALDYLKNSLKSDGGIYDKYYFTHIHSEVVLELLKAGEDLTAECWSKDGKNIIDGLFKYWNGKYFVDKSGAKNTVPYKDVLYTLSLIKEAGYGDKSLNEIKFDNLDKEEPEKSCKANITVVYPKDDGNLEVKLKPVGVVVNNKKQSAGLTVLGALQSATDNFKIDGKLITSIFGIERKDSNGWVYTINGVMPSTYANETVIKDGDKVVWYYSKNGMNAKIPSYDEILNNENNENGSSINSIIDGVINYYNNVHFIQNQRQLLGFEYAAMYKAKADLTKKSWYLSEKYESSYDKELKNLAGKVKQSLILIDLDKDPTNYSGRNFIDEIAKEIDECNNYFAQVEIEAVIALDKYNEKFKDKKIDYNVQHAIEKILEAQCEDGGFKQRSSSAIPNTAYALRALSKHKDINGANEAINKALEYLKDKQHDDGGIYESTYITNYHGEVIQGIIAVGENPTSNKWTTTLGKNPVKALFNLWKDNNSFDSKSGESTNNRGWVEATWKALDTLTSLQDAGYGDYIVEGVKVNKFGEEEIEEKTCKVNVAIVIPEAGGYDCMFSPQEVVISNKKHNGGFTALGALQGATILYEIKGKTVTSIYGIENSGSNGWIYTVNGVMPNVMAEDMEVKAGDKIIWYYSMDGMNAKIPTWEQLVSNGGDDNKDYIKKTNEAIDSASKVVLKSEINEWDIIALSAAGKNIPEAYLKDITERIKNRDPKLFMDDKFKVITDCERIIIGVVAAGGDPRDIGNYNLLEDLCSRKLQRESEIFTLAYALIALDSGNFDIPKTATFTREKIADRIIAFQFENDGGWGWSLADPDSTAMMLIGLSNYTKNPKVQASVDKAVEALSKMQNNNGGYTSTWDNNVESSESASQAIIALCALGIDPTSDKFTKNGKNLMNFLFSFKTTDGGFAHVRDDLSKSDPIATQQALQALAAYKNFKEGKKGSIYLFKDFNNDQKETKEIEIRNMTKVKEFKLGEEAKITVEATNNSKIDKKASVVIALYDDNNKIVNYVALKNVIKPGEKVDLEGMMSLPKSGKYKVKALVWDSLESMNSLSEVIEIPVK